MARRFDEACRPLCLLLAYDFSASVIVTLTPRRSSSRENTLASATIALQKASRTLPHALFASRWGIRSEVPRGASFHRNTRHKRQSDGRRQVAKDWIRQHHIFAQAGALGEDATVLAQMPRSMI